MVVCMSRRICVLSYIDEIVTLRPDWRSGDDDARRSIKIVMTGSASDPVEWQPHIPQQARVARRWRTASSDPDDPFKLVIVRDMWLTGFDAPCLHTMYVDKPMHGHGLMQAIARVNRVFTRQAGRAGRGLPRARARAEGCTCRTYTARLAAQDEPHGQCRTKPVSAYWLEKYRSSAAVMFYGFSWPANAISGTPQERLGLLSLAGTGSIILKQREWQRSLYR